MYELFEGRLPFAAPSLNQLLFKHVEQAPPPQVADESPQTLKDLVSHLLEKAPADRPGSARFVVRALDSLFEGPDTSFEGDIYELGAEATGDPIDDEDEDKDSIGPGHPSYTSITDLTRPSSSSPLRPALFAGGLVAALALVAVLLAQGDAHTSESEATRESPPKASTLAPAATDSKTQQPGTLAASAVTGKTMVAKARAHVGSAVSISVIASGSAASSTKNAAASRAKERPRSHRKSRVAKPAAKPKPEPQKPKLEPLKLIDEY